MEEITLPPVLINLIHNINSQGHLNSWQLKSTLETHSLTLEWTRTTTCNINDYQSVGSDSTLQSLEKKSDQSVVSNEDCGDEYSSQAIYVTEKDATCEHSDFLRDFNEFWKMRLNCTLITNLKLPKPC